MDEDVNVERLEAILLDLQVYSEGSFLQERLKEALSIIDDGLLMDNKVIDCSVCGNSGVNCHDCCHAYGSYYFPKKV